MDYLQRIKPKDKKLHSYLYKFRKDIKECKNKTECKKIIKLKTTEYIQDLLQHQKKLQKSYPDVKPSLNSLYKFIYQNILKSSFYAKYGGEDNILEEDNTLKEDKIQKIIELSIQYFKQYVEKHKDLQFSTKLLKYDKCDFKEACKKLSNMSIALALIFGENQVHNEINLNYTGSLPFYLNILNTNRNDYISNQNILKQITNNTIIDTYDYLHPMYDYLAVYLAIYDVIDVDIFSKIDELVNKSRLMSTILPNQNLENKTGIFFFDPLADIDDIVAMK